VFLENGLRLGAAQVMQSLWAGESQEHLAPIISSLTVDGSTAADSVHLKQGKAYRALLSIDTQSDPALSYRWEIMREVDKDVESDGGDFEPTPEVVWQQSSAETSNQVEFVAPDAGEYRLYAYVEDRHGSAATANVPILVAKK
jgi:hypothetical protein